MQNSLFQSLDGGIVGKEGLTDFNGIGIVARRARALSPKTNRTGNLPRANGVRVNVNSVQFGKTLAGVGVQIFHSRQFLSFGGSFVPLCDYSISHI